MSGPCCIVCKSKEKLNLCADCQTFVYCSKACLKKDYATHEKECKIISQSRLIENQNLFVSNQFISGKTEDESKKRRKNDESDNDVDDDKNNNPSTTTTTKPSKRANTTMTKSSSSSTSSTLSNPSFVPEGIFFNDSLVNSPNKFKGSFYVQRFQALSPFGTNKPYDINYIDPHAIYESRVVYHYYVRSMYEAIGDPEYGELMFRKNFGELLRDLDVNRYVTYRLKQEMSPSKKFSRHISFDAMKKLIQSSFELNWTQMKQYNAMQNSIDKVFTQMRNFESELLLSTEDEQLHLADNKSAGKDVVNIFYDEKFFCFSFDGIGEDIYGKLLMEKRTELRKEIEKKKAYDSKIAPFIEFKNSDIRKKIEENIISKDKVILRGPCMFVFYTLYISHTTSNRYSYYDFDIVFIKDGESVTNESFYDLLKENYMVRVFLTIYPHNTTTKGVME